MPADGGMAQVSVEKLIEAATRVGKVSAEFADRLEATNTRVARLLEDSWSGNPGAAYARAFEEWTEGTAKVQCGLAEMASALAGNARAYAGQDGATTCAIEASAGEGNNDANTGLSDPR
jgi:WXG100 family type VII secretion target